MPCKFQAFMRTHVTASEFVTEPKELVWYPSWYGHWSSLEWTCRTTRQTHPSFKHLCTCMQLPEHLYFSPSQLAHPWRARHFLESVSNYEQVYFKRLIPYPQPQPCWQSTKVSRKNTDTGQIHVYERKNLVHDIHPHRLVAAHAGDSFDASTTWMTEENSSTWLNWGRVGAQGMYIDHLWQQLFQENITLLTKLILGLQISKLMELVNDIPQPHACTRTPRKVPARRLAERRRCCSKLHKRRRNPRPKLHILYRSPVGVGHTWVLTRLSVYKLCVGGQNNFSSW